ncbi:MAG: hypothetical protein OEY14_00295 [Myxococcales bacterium]|nr:hypothetical protein [Myxococcales bacterium]
MSEDIAGLLLELERCAVDPERALPDQVERMLLHRQEILGRLQGADTSVLDPETLAELRRRLDAIRQRDERLLRVLLERHRELEEKLQEVLKGRTAVRGYRAADLRIVAGLDRRG